MSLSTFLTSLRHDKRGNVLMLTGLALVPLTFATGMAIDYSRAARLQTKLNAAADAAALSTTREPMMTESIKSACNLARRTFQNAVQDSAAGLTFDDTTGPTISITEKYATGADVTYDCPKVVLSLPSTFTQPTVRTTTVTYNGQSQNAFAGVLGSAAINIGGTSTSRTAVAQYLDFHLALDTSQSMGLAATDAAATALYNKTVEVNGPGEGCAFGCHVYSGSASGYNLLRISNEDIARINGIRMRIDSLRDAAAEMIQSAMEAQGNQDLYRFGLYRLGATTSTISALSNNLTGAKTTVQGLRLGVNTAAGTGDTNLQDMAKTMLSTITTHGSGSSRANAASYLFIVTDGVQDIWTAGSTYSFDGTNFNCDKYNWNHCTGVIKAADCARLKANNVTVGVVYTTYLPIRSNPTSSTDMSLRSEYTGLVQDFAANIKPALQGCASDPSWFLEASDGPGIEAAMQKLFAQAMETSRLTR